MTTETEKEIVDAGQLWPESAEEVLEKAVLLRRSTSGGNADVYVLEREGCRYLVKSYLHHSWLSKMLFSAIAVANEWRLLKRLEKEGFTYAPRPVARLGKWVVITEYIQGSGPLLGKRHYRDREMPPREFFSELLEAYRKLHDLGIVHGDVRRQNILVGEDGRPRIIDWATGTIVGESMPKWRVVSRWVHNVQGVSDCSSLARIVKCFYPELITHEMEAQNSRFLKIGRYIRQKLYRPLKHYFRNKKR